MAAKKQTTIGKVKSSAKRLVGRAIRHVKRRSIARDAVNERTKRPNNGAQRRNAFNKSIRSQMKTEKRIRAVNKRKYGPL